MPCVWATPRGGHDNMQDDIRTEWEGPELIVHGKGRKPAPLLWGIF
jgi:hypothetical protein